MAGTPPIAPKKFLTNQGENTLSKRLEKILPLTQAFDCLVGYFFISGFFRLYPALESVKKVRIRKEIARQYLLGPAHKPDKDARLALREVILSSYLP